MPKIKLPNIPTAPEEAGPAPRTLPNGRRTFSEMPEAPRRRGPAPQTLPNGLPAEPASPPKKLPMVASEPQKPGEPADPSSVSLSDLLAGGAASEGAAALVSRMAPWLSMAGLLYPKSTADSSVDEILKRNYGGMEIGVPVGHGGGSGGEMGGQAMPGDAPSSSREAQMKASLSKIKADQAQTATDQAFQMNPNLQNSLNKAKNLPRTAEDDLRDQPPLTLEGMNTIAPRLLENGENQDRPLRSVQEIRELYKKLLGGPKHDTIRYDNGNVEKSEPPTTLKNLLK